MTYQANPIPRKLEASRQELLDLGLRNPLLNYRTLKARGLDIVREKSPEVFRILVTDKRKMSFEANSRSEEEQATVPSIDADSYVDSKLQTDYPVKALEHRLLNTYLSARTYIEEQGVNILYLALGMLHWYESPSSQEKRQAPLVLVPVRLDRVSAKERFTLAYTEDEVGHNISLLAKMKAEFGLELPELPDVEEIELASYYQAVTKSVEGQNRWVVEEDAIALGFFSFGKFMMYRDLDVTKWPEHVKPEEHPILEALLTEGFREPASTIGEEEPIDPYLDLSSSLYITDADSSQIVALLDAKQGRNLVIQGPPGTGKSQTITNLIAEAIADGKKVLFVSEKMAALEVVKRRLDAAGLGDACLELHSHKTNKKTLLKELAATMELSKPKRGEGTPLELLEETRKRLNEYAAAMNTKLGQSGVTPYQALGKLAVMADDATSAMVPEQLASPERIADWTAAEFAKREALIEELRQVIRKMGVPRRHPFWGSLLRSVLPNEAASIRQAAEEASQRTKLLSDTLIEAGATLQVPAATDHASAQTLLHVLERAIDAPDLAGIQLRSELWLSRRQDLEKLANDGLAYKRLRAEFDPRLIPEAWEQNLLVTRGALVTYRDKWWRFLSGDYRRARRTVASLRRDPRDRTADELSIVDAIMTAARLRTDIEANGSLGSELFAERWQGPRTDWSMLAAIVDFATSLHADCRSGALPAWALEVVAGGRSRAEAERTRATIDRLVSDHRSALRSVEEKLAYDNRRAYGQERLDYQPYDVIRERAELWRDRIQELHEMASYNHLSQMCESEELGSFADYASDWEHAGEALTFALRRRRYEALAVKAFAERPELATFDGSRHDQAVSNFRTWDKALNDTNRQLLALAHWSTIPRHEGGGQLAILRREFEKKSRHLPIRQLMSKAGHAIQAIKPVFMMGPLSIATYIEPGSLSFDLVVFDEASQVKPVDAFGALIRAKQAIVVGDSRQMPPSNFFDSIAKEDDEDEDSFVADMESVLSLFAGQNAPQRMLRWHYRSRHESLIAVSNYEFYDNRLVVFPSPDSDREQMGLRYHYLPDSHYDRGRSRTNRAEAQAVARAVMKHARLQPELTLGVAAFSMSQMQAIVDELEVMRRADSSLEPYFAAHPHEPFFVKNLENVQGDERDVIFISIGYGKTAEGYLAMEFGPLNREGGERRLNVLITRARKRCEVFTNLKAEDIDLDRTKSIGVKALKSFLKYADQGILDVPIETGRDYDSDFEQAVARKLQELGYDVRRQIGSAGFYVDLAVVDSEKPGQYVIGIECDGATYHSARSARDRDRLRQQVLEGLGWTIHRVWSSDWFRHSERELKRIVEAIQASKTNALMRQTVDDQREEAEIEREDEPEPADIEQPSSTPYITANISVLLGEQEFHQLPSQQIADWISEIVRVESPVHVGEVMKRICDAAGIKRLGVRIQEKFQTSLPLARDVRAKGEFLWLAGMEVPPVRTRTDTGKKLSLVAPEELGEAILQTVRLSFGAGEEAIASGACHLLGFSRVTEEMRGLVREAIGMLVEHKALVRQGDVYVYGIYKS